MELIEIDGSVLEGGGQILRNALSLSCILKRPIRVFNIRAGRPKPGLAAQHLFGLNLLKQITNANVTGNSIGSTAIEFYPGEIQSGHYCVDTKTAGSISLVMQVALPVLLFGKDPSKLEVKGGTNAAMAPQVDFTSEIFRPNLEQFGASFDFQLIRRGYYPKGGGHCIYDIPPVKQLNGFKNTEFGRVLEIFGWSYVAGALHPRVASDMANGAQQVLRSACPPDKINIEPYKEDAHVGTCSGIIIGAATSNGCILGSSGLGDRRESAWDTGIKAGTELLGYLQDKQCTDQHIQDQLIIYMALAEGESEMNTCKLTTHTFTAIHIAEVMTGIKFETVEGVNSTVKCIGLGIKNKLISQS